MNALVTGANGFLGRAVVAALRGDGHRVRALIRPAATAPAEWDNDVEVVRADLRAGAPAGIATDITVVVHLAASVAGDEHEQFAAGARGTEHLLDRLDGGPRRLVLASSFAVYDWDAAGDTITEDTPLATGLENRGGYTVAKLWQERLAARYGSATGAEIAVLRPGFIWGRGNADVSGVGLRLGRVQAVIGGRRRVLPLTYVENCADAFRLAAVREEAANTALNVVDDPPVSAWEFAHALARHTGDRSVPVPVPYGAGALAGKAVALMNGALFGGHGRVPSVLVPERYTARFGPLRFPNDRIRSVLGWSPLVGFDEAMRRTFDPQSTP